MWIEPKAVGTSIFFVSCRSHASGWRERSFTHIFPETQAVGGLILGSGPLSGAEPRKAADLELGGLSHFRFRSGTENRSNTEQTSRPEIRSLNS